MSQRSGILAGGNWILDTVKVVDVYPEQDALANILEETVCNGGSPYNVLVDLAMLRAPFPLAGVGLIGQDAAGDRILEHCRSLGIDTAGIQTTDRAATSYTDVITVRSTGRRTFFHQRGANALLDVEHFDFSASSAKIFHLGYLLLLDRLDMPSGRVTGAGQVLERAKLSGMITSVDVVSEDSDRFESVVIPALRFVDICLLNEFEASRTTGVELREDGRLLWGRLAAAAQSLLRHGVGKWVIIHFPEGAFALSAKGEDMLKESPSISSAQIASVVGAGDAFAAGALYGFHEEKGIDVCLEYGFQAAAACMTDRTTSGGIRPLVSCK